MTALAQVLQQMGKTVWGSDVSEPFFTDDILAREKIKVLSPFASEHITADIELLVYSTAYSESNAEFAAAKRQGVAMLSYPQAVGLLFQDRYGIAVCGTHGKTTTTAMLGYALQELGADPLVIVGSDVPQLGGAARFGAGKYFVLEADEYQNKLQYYHPQAVILTSADWDHPDYFPDQAAYSKVFKDFVARIPADGLLVAFTDDPNVAEIAKSASGEVVEYGTGGFKNFMPEDPIFGGVGILLQARDGRFIWQHRDMAAKKNPGMICPFGGKKKSHETSIQTLCREMMEELELDVDPACVKKIGDFASHIMPGVNLELFYLDGVELEKLVLHEGEEILTMTLEEALANPKVTIFTKEVILAFQGKKQPYLQVIGEHNVWNATAVLALLAKLGFNLGAAKKALGQFTGCKRRFELLGEERGVLVYDDYAHHPVEVQKLLKAARGKFPERKIWAVFQAHTYTRTRALLEDFGTSFTDADAVIVLPIFCSARETQGGVTPDDLVAKIHTRSQNVSYQGNLEQAAAYLAGAVQRGDVVLTIGAGENWKVGVALLEKLRIKTRN